MISRRDFILTTISAGTALAASAAKGQPARRTYRLGWVSASATRAERYSTAFTRRLAELGFVEGRNLEIVSTDSYGKFETMQAAAVEIARRRCDVIFAPGNEVGLRAVTQAAPTTPTVVVAADFDPVASGFVAQLARPGGSVTGISLLQSELPAKRVQVLKELMPKLQRAAVLADPISANQLKVTRAAAARLKINLTVHEFTRTPYDFREAFETFKREKAEGLLVLGSGFFVPSRKLIPQLASDYRLPAVFHNDIWVENGGLLSYGSNFSAAYASAANLVAKLFGGAKPGELPMEQATIIEMALNLNAARAQNLKIPEGIRLRADRVIE